MKIGDLVKVFFDGHSTIGVVTRMTLHDFIEVYAWGEVGSFKVGSVELLCLK
tara:strand:- start:1154 stop:1309 length:156 start_codon:yes stop_codon:yes gene_type:complete